MSGDTVTNFPEKKESPRKRLEYSQKDRLDRLSKIKGVGYGQDQGYAQSHIKDQKDKNVKNVPAKETEPGYKHLLNQMDGKPFMHPL